MFLVDADIIRITSDLVFVQDMEDMDVDQIEGSAGAADDTEGVWQRLLSERRAVKRHYYRVEHGIACFLIIQMILLVSSPVWP
jgi:hypothetical protein